MSATIASLALDHFRSHKTRLLTLTANQILITGPNGAGKTNILEACSLLAPGRGLRHKAAEHMLHHHHKNTPWRISADLHAYPNSPLEISYTTGKISRTFAGNPLSQSDLNSVLGVWWHTPLVDHLLQTPSARRQIIDRCASRINTNHLSTLSAYKHFTQERLDALARSLPSVLIETLEERITQLAQSITHERFATLDALKPFLNATPLPKTSVTIDATSTLEKLWLNAPDTMAQHLRSNLAKDRTRDAQYKRMHTSVQHAAFTFSLKKTKSIPLELCSTGQRKICSLSLLLASLQHYKHTTPMRPTVLLLDETFSHMDEDTCRHITHALHTLDTQTWCTAHNTHMLEHLHHAQHIELPHPS